MRLTNLEKFALMNSIKDINQKVYLFWSRVDDKKKWWDIDILVINDWTFNDLELSLLIQREFFKKCEEKLDVIIMHKNMNEDEKIFFNSIHKICLKN